MRGLVNPGGSSESSPTRASQQHVAGLKDVVRSALALDAQSMVLVQQLACTEPGCPPVETVVAVLGSPRRTWKIPNPTADVSTDGLRALITEHPKGTNHDHTT